MFSGQYWPTCILNILCTSPAKISVFIDLLIISSSPNIPWKMFNFPPQTHTHLKIEERFLNFFLPNWMCCSAFWSTWWTLKNVRFYMWKRIFSSARCQCAGGMGQRCLHPVFTGHILPRLRNTCTRRPLCSTGAHLISAVALMQQSQVQLLGNSVDFSRFTLV